MKLTHEEAIKELEFLVRGYEELYHESRPGIKVRKIMEACKMGIVALVEQAEEEN